MFIKLKKLLYECFQLVECEWEGRRIQNKKGRKIAIESRHEGIKRRRKLVHSITIRMKESNQEEGTCFNVCDDAVSILRALSRKVLRDITSLTNKYTF